MKTPEERIEDCPERLDRVDARIDALEKQIQELQAAIKPPANPNPGSAYDLTSAPSLTDLAHQARVTGDRRSLLTYLRARSGRNT